MNEQEITDFLNNLEELGKEAKKGTDLGVVFAVRDIGHNVCYSKAFGAFNDNMVLSIYKGLEPIKRDIELKRKLR